MTDRRLVDLYAQQQADLLPVGLSPPGDQSLTAQVFASPVDAYLASLGSAASRRTMASAINSISREMGFMNYSEVPWRLINKQAITLIVAQFVERGMSRSTITAYLAAIRGVAQAAWEMKLIDTDTFQAIRLVKARGKISMPKGRALEGMELRQLLDDCAHDSRIQGLRDAAMIWILYGAGLRRSEIVALDLSHRIHRDKALRVLGKGNRERLCYLSDEAWQSNECWIAEARGETPGPLFTRIRAGDDITMDRLSDQSVYYMLEQRCIRAGIDRVRPHDMRKTTITTLLDLGEDIRTAQLVAGHASINTTQKYDRRGEARKRKAAAKLTI